MRRARNAVVIIILCIIGNYSLVKKAAPVLDLPGTEELRDAVRGTRASRPGLNFGQTNDGELRDAVANNAAIGTPRGNADGSVGAPPRGSGNGGFGPIGTNPGQNLLPPVNPPPSVLSQSGPNQE